MNVQAWKRPGRPTVWRYDYIDPKGKRVRRTARTQEEAEERAARSVLEGDRHLAPVLAKDITVQAFARYWLTVELPQDDEVKQGTRETYAKHLDLYIVPKLGGMKVRDLRRPVIKDLLRTRLESLRERGKKGKATVRLTLATLRRFLGAALEMEIVTANHAAGVAKSLGLGNKKSGGEQGAGLKKAFSREDRDRVLTTAWEEDRWCAPMWTVQVLTGMRPGEVYALTEADLNLDPTDGTGPTVTVSKTLSDDGKRVETTPKGGESRAVDLSAAAVATLRAHLKWRKVEKLRRGWTSMPTPLFFAADGGHHLPCDVRKRLYAVLDAAGLPHRGPHAFRHTFAALTAPVKGIYYTAKQLGHGDINLTFRVYTKGDQASEAGGLDMLDPAVGVTSR